jgi:signal transduction histidine kinase
MYPDADLPPGTYVRLEISDTGCGIPDDILPRVFDPFFTTKFVGRGLGLSAVQGILRAHGGAIRLDSSPGEGTRAELIFPVRVPDAASQASDSSGKSSSALIR